MKNNNQMLQTSISACDVPTQKQWYKQQIAEFYSRLNFLKKVIKECQLELLMYCGLHANNIYTLQTTKCDDENYKRCENNVHQSFEKIKEVLFHLINVQYKYTLDDHILNELQAENSVLYSCHGGFYE